MGENNKNICTICNRVYSTKYTLSTHIRCVHKQCDVEEFECKSKYCKYTTMYKKEIVKHIKNCNFIIAEEDFKQVEIELKNKIKSEYETCIEKLKKELLTCQTQLSSLTTEKDIIQRELEKSQHLIQCLSERAIDRPSNVTNRQHNEIGNVKITNHLSDHQTYLKQVHPERVTGLLDLHFEKYFMDGQIGLARFVVEHIIRLENGKMILCCTDPTRKRFRFIDTDKKLAEDLKAKMLCSKIKVPVKEMCNEVFDRIIQRLKDEKKVKMSSGLGMEMEIDFLDRKIDMAERRFLEIRAFDGDDGTEFLNELAILLRNP